MTTTDKLRKLVARAVRHCTTVESTTDAILAALAPYLATPETQAAIIAQARKEGREDALKELVPQPQPSHLGNWFCEGPDGHFWADKLETARRLVNLIDKDDDWTVTEAPTTPEAKP